MSSPAPKWFKRLRRLTSFVLPGNRNSRIRREKFLMENGRMLLEESITLFDGKINPIRFFSLEELQNASNNFDQKLVIHYIGGFQLYRCSLQNRMVILKKYCFLIGESAIRDIVVASRMSVHKNVMKLIGCCLETKLPILVFDCYECTLFKPLSLFQNYPPLSPFQDWIETLQWKDRLKIAVDLSNLLAYLHTAFPTPIVHRRFDPTSFLPDDYGCLKLSDFSSSIPMPEGESSITADRINGMNVFIAPEYIVMQEFNEKMDVYSFGIILLIVLSGRTVVLRTDIVHLMDHIKRCEENGRFDEILDLKLLEEESWPGKYNQFEDILRLALYCVRNRPDDRPDIIDVAKKLKEMHQLLTPDS